LIVPPALQRSPWLALAAIAAVAVQMVGWSALLRYNLPRAEAVIEAQPERRNFLVMSADFGEYRDYYRDYPKSISEMNRNNTFNEYYKRPLYGPISASLGLGLRLISGIEYPDSMFLILSFYPSFAGVLFFWLMRRVGLNLALAVGLTAVCIVSFGWLSLFSVPESYSLAVCSIVTTLLSGSGFARGGELRRAAVLRHAFVAGMGSWVYLPAAASAVLIVPALRKRRQWLTLLLPAIGLAAIVGYAPHLLYGSESAAVQIAYAKKWMGLGNFLDIGIVGKVVASFLFFSIIAPVPDFVAASPDPDGGGGASGFALALMLMQAVFMLGLAWHARLDRLAGIACLMAILVGFHIIYNPQEVLLYLSPIVPVLVLGVALLLADYTARQPAGTPVPAQLTTGLYLFVVAQTYVNVRAVLGV
jgi:hypothetical protein